MAYLFNKKIIFVVILLGAHAPSYSMQLLREVRKSVCSQGALRNPTLHKTASAQLGSRLLSSSRQSSVSEESEVAAQQRRKTHQECKERYANIALLDALILRSGAARWERICRQTVIDLELRYDKALFKELERARDDEKRAGINLLKAEQRVAQAERELAVAREQLRTSQ